MNYDLSVEQAGQGRQAGGLFELGAFGGFGVATGTMVARQEPLAIARSCASIRPGPGTFPNHRHAAHGRRDLHARAMGPRGAFRRRAVRHQLQHPADTGSTPLLAAQGEAVVPSTVDVFVNGQQIASESVPPGPFTIDHLPVLTGAGQLQVVVTDALGREQVMVQPYYSGTALLREGLERIFVRTRQRAAGLRLEQFRLWRSARRSDVPSRVERQPDWRRACGSADGRQLRGWRRRGVAGGHLGHRLDAARRGRRQGDSGWLAGVGLEHNGPRLAAYLRLNSAAVIFHSSAQACSSRSKAADIRRHGFRFRRVRHAATGLRHAELPRRRQRRDLRPQLFTGAATVRLSRPVCHPHGFRRGGLQHPADLDNAARRAPLGQFGGPVLAGPGGRQWRTAGHGDRAAEPADGQRLGYNVSLSTRDEANLGVAYQGHAGLATLDYSRRGDSSGVRAGATGGVAITGAGVMPARRLEQSFAVVQVADYAGLTVFLDNQPIGRTDAKGRVLVDALRPYQRNEISLDPTQVPMDGAIDQSAIGVTPAYRSGALVRFPVTRAMAPRRASCGATARRCRPAPRQVHGAGASSRSRSTACCTSRACMPRPRRASPGTKASAASPCAARPATTLCPTSVRCNASERVMVGLARGICLLASNCATAACRPRRRRLSVEAAA